MKKNFKRSVKINHYNRIIVKLERETAWEQFLEAVGKLDDTLDDSTEYTMDFSCFSAEERRELEMKMTHALAVRAAVRGRMYEICHTPLPVNH